MAWLILLAPACADAPRTAPSTPATAASSTTIPPTSTTVPTTTTTVPPTSTTAAATTTTTTRPPLEPPTYATVEKINRIRAFTGYTSRGLWRWQQMVSAVEDIELVATADGTRQPVLWLPPSGEGDRPLLVVLHSWSSTYVQHAGIPYAMWAWENGWAMIAPEFRGRNDDPDAIGSELAVQDVVDAIDFATAQDGVDGDRVFVVGYSGGGMMALLIAGRHPEKVTAVAAWGAVYDLIDFYARSRSRGKHYSWEIVAACGGDPRTEGAARDECLQRSPMTYLDGAREAGVPVFLGHGLYDTLLDPRQSARAFNQLADPDDRFTDEEIEMIGKRKIPEEITGGPGFDTYFGPADFDVLLARRSASVRVVYFASGHEMAYLATMRWFATDPVPLPPGTIREDPVDPPGPVEIDLRPSGTGEPAVG